MNINLRKYCSKQCLSLNYKSLFLLTSVLLFISMMIMSRNAGISGDEYFKVDHAEKVYDYYVTLGKDDSAVDTDLPLQKYNGQSFDNIVYFINKLFNVDDIYRSRHLFNALLGFLLILYTGLMAKDLFGWKAGIIALLLIFFSPRILGHSLNNPKDIPFAATYIFSLYFIFKFIRNIPKIKVSNVILIIIGIAASISIRIGGLILVPYLFLFTGIYYSTKKKFYTKSGISEAIKFTGIIAVIGIISYMIGLILWPFGLEHPIKNPIEALTKMTNYDIGLNQLFEGEIKSSKLLPWYYGAKYIIITSPVIVFVGLLLFLIILPARSKDSKNSHLFYSFLIFAFVFPIVYTIYKNSNLYGGWRHLLWTYSPIVILSSGGLEYFISHKNRYLRYGSIAISLLLLLIPIRHTFKNHPYEYIYYNQLVGGVNGAYGNYEMDYYYHGLKGASDWFIKNELPKYTSTDTITIATNHARITEYYFRKYPNVKIIYCRYYEKSNSYWDYSLWSNTHITPLQLKKGYWPPKENIHSVLVDTVPIAAVVKRISYEDFEGYKAIQKKEIDDAIKHFENYLKVYPENEEVYKNLANAYLMKKDYDHALAFSDSSLYYNPRMSGALLIKTNCLNYFKKYTEGLKTANELIEVNDALPEAHFIRGATLEELSRSNDALVEFQKAISLRKDYYEAYMMAGDILINYKKYKQAIEKLYPEVLKFREKDLMAIVNIAKCFHFMNQNDKAEELLQELDQKYNNHFEVVKLKCRLEMAKGNNNNAGRLLNMARNISNNSDLFVIRAKYCLATNQPTRAKSFLDKAKELDNNNNEALTLLKSFQSTTQNNNSGNSNKQKSVVFRNNNEESGEQTNPLIQDW